MAKYFSNPNPYSKTLSKKFLNNLFILLSFMGGTALAYRFSKNISISFALLGYSLILLAIFAMKKIFTSMGKNDRGEEAETKIKNILMELPDNYSIYQNVLVKNPPDIDFVLVGPNGIFAIEVKSFARKYYFYQKNPVDQVFKETMKLKNYLHSEGVKMYIHGVLVYSRARVQYNIGRKGICTTPSDFLLTFIAQTGKSNFDRQTAEAAIAKLHL